MNMPVRMRVLVFTLFATTSLLALSGCGGQSDSGTAKDASNQSVSKYESEINKSKPATPKKAAR